MKNIIERKLAAGVLPDRPPVKYWAGFGVGQPCDGCDEPILDTQVEYEVAFDAFPDSPLARGVRRDLGCTRRPRGPGCGGRRVMVRFLWA
jgi:hypothetical protein